MKCSLALQLPATTPVPFVYPGSVWVAPVSVAHCFGKNSVLTAFVSEDPATVGRDGATTSHHPQHLRACSLGMWRCEQRCSERHSIPRCTCRGEDEYSGLANVRIIDEGHRR